MLLKGRLVLDLESIDDPRLSAWPFWALQLSPDSSASDVEKAYSELKAKLALGVASAAQYTTPFGPRQRDEYGLRDARALLIAPESRLLAEFWYVSPDIKSSASVHANPQEDQHSLDAYQILKVKPAIGAGGKP